MGQGLGPRSRKESGTAGGEGHASLEGFCEGLFEGFFCQTVVLGVKSGCYRETQLQTSEGGWQSGRMRVQLRLLLTTGLLQPPSGQLGVQST